jgi:hypothetical protein
MEPLPPLLETYEEARLLLEAKGWGIAKAAEHLSEMRELARFHISHPKLSKKTAPGSKFPIEPEVAAAVEGMETRIGYEQQTEIVTAGLRAAHAGRPAAGVRARLPVGLRVSRFLRKLAERFGRASWKPIFISAGSGALVGCLALLLGAPLLPSHANAAVQPGLPVVIIHHPTLGGSPLWFEPGSLLAIGDPGGGPKRPAEQEVPKFTLPGQKVAPCDEGLGQETIHGNCWLPVAKVKPPCGRLFRHGDFCYLPVAAEPKKPAL